MSLIGSTICAWCGVVITAGDEDKPRSHGICETCSGRVIGEIDMTVDASVELEFISCYWCEQPLVDGEGARIAWMYGHPACAAEHDEILARGLMRELSDDERRD